MVLCTLALLASVAALEDYGVAPDAFIQRNLAYVTLQYMTGDSDAFETLDTYSDRFYGTAFEVPLLLAERALGLDDGRSAFLVRHLLSHLFFLAAGFTGYLLSLRLFRSRAVALFALALFLLHPRIYAHSFSNSKDVPFLGLFMICLWLASRAFAGRGSQGGEDKGRLGAFALCGVAAGLLVNLRVMGLVFVAVVAAVRVCDWRGARGERRLVLATLVVFLASAAVAYYASMPYLWADPFGRFAELLETLSNHPTRPLEIFQGELVSAAALPAHYVPFWFALTTPPLALLLGAVGVASLARRGMARPDALLRNTPLRFELLLAACVALPLLTIAILRPTMHDDWRHTYFLWAPFTLLAASGLRTLADAAGTCRCLPLSPRLAGLAVHGLAALGLVAVAVQMARLHPHQRLYFNALATRATSEPLHERYSMGYPEIFKDGDSYILEEFPAEIVNMQPRRYTRRAESLLAWPYSVAPRHMELRSRRERQRVQFDRNIDPDFHMELGSISQSASFPPVLYERRLYGHAILRVATPNLSRLDEATADAYRALSLGATAGAPVLGGDIDVYRSETAITWVKENCAAGDLHDRVSLTVVPADADRFPAFTRRIRGVRVDSSTRHGNGTCLWRTSLPNHTLAKIHLHGIGSLLSDVYLDELRTRYAALAVASPAARSTFDVHWRDGKLFYVKATCVQTDIAAPFFLHIVPVDADDLHRSRRQHGFEAQDFRTDGADAVWRSASADFFDGACMAAQNLPAYPIARIATGQYTPDGSLLWRVDISAGDG